MQWTRDDAGVWRCGRLAAWRTLRGWRWASYRADGSVSVSGTERTLADARRAAGG